jgi:hypothetical protein
MINPRSPLLLTLAGHNDLLLLSYCPDGLIPGGRGNTTLARMSGFDAAASVMGLHRGRVGPCG